MEDLCIASGTRSPSRQIMDPRRLYSLTTRRGGRLVGELDAHTIISDVLHVLHRAIAAEDDEALRFPGLPVDLKTEILEGLAQAVHQLRDCCHQDAGGVAAIKMHSSSTNVTSKTGEECSSGDQATDVDASFQNW